MHGLVLVLNKDLTHVPPTHAQLEHQAMQIAKTGPERCERLCPCCPPFPANAIDIFGRIFMKAIFSTDYCSCC